MSKVDPLSEFVVTYRKDQESGTVRRLGEYLREFPGASEGITQHYVASEGGLRSQGAASGSHTYVGGYRIVRELGRGGQGVVYLAEDPRLGRKVAVKVLNAVGPGSEHLLERFRREAQVTARLDHPGICNILESGADGNMPWIAMRYIEGESLASRIAKARSAERDEDVMWIDLEISTTKVTPPLADSVSDMPSSWAQIAGILLIIEKVAIALHAAHEAGVIHRDVKPGNIMLAQDGDPVVLDFGLARALDEAQPTLTQTGDLFGTPAYMSPEQLMAQRVRLDRRTDVFSLGAVLYECLTLKRAFDAPTRDALYHSIMVHEPAQADLFNPGVSKDLLVVIAHAIAKDRDHRYQTALSLAEDLRRVRCQEPILARPVSSIQRAVLWARRNPALAAAVSAILVFLIGFGVWSDLKSRELSRALDLARHNGKESERQYVAAQAALARESEALEIAGSESLAKAAALEDALGQLLSAESILTRETNAELAVRLAIEGASRSPGLYANQALLGSLEVWCRQTLLEAGVGNPTKLSLHPEISPCGKWVAALAESGFITVSDASSGKSKSTIQDTLLGVKKIGFRSDGTTCVRLRIDDKGGEIAEWDVKSGILLRSNALESESEFRFVEASHHGNLWLLEKLRAREGGLAVGNEKTFEVWSVDQSKLVCSIRADHDARARFLPLGDGIGEVSGSIEPNIVRVRVIEFDKESTRYESEIALQEPRSDCDFAFSTSGRFLAFGSRRKNIGAAIFDVSASRLVSITDGERSMPETVKFSPDEKMLITVPRRYGRGFVVFGTGPIGVWEVATGRNLGVFGDGWTSPMDAEFVHSGASVAVLGEDGGTSVWRIRDNQIIANYSMSGGVVTRAKFHDGGLRASAVSNDGVIRLWELESRVGIPEISNVFYIQAAVVSPDGNRAAICAWHKSFLVDMCTLKVIAPLKGIAGRIEAACMSDDGAILAVATGAKILVYDAHSGILLRVLPCDGGKTRDIQFFGDGNLTLLSQSSRGSIRIWQVSTGELRQMHDVPGDILTMRHLAAKGSAFIALYDGRWAIADLNKPNSEIPWRKTEPGASFPLESDAEGQRILCASFISAHGAREVTGLSASVCVIDAASGATVGSWTYESDAHLSVALNPNGSCIAVGRSDGAELLALSSVGWSRRTLDLKASVTQVLFSRDGTHLATVSDDRTIRIWSVSGGSELQRIQIRGSKSLGVAFSDNGDWLVVIEDERTRLIPMDLLGYARSLQPRALSEVETSRYGLSKPASAR